jgi:ribonuclease HII
VCFVKGDGRFSPIAAASILAKTHRDQYIEELAEQYPQYGWRENKGYPTEQHRKAVAEFGLSPFHRKTFRVKEQQLELF